MPGDGRDAPSLQLSCWAVGGGGGGDLFVGEPHRCPGLPVPAVPAHCPAVTLLPLALSQVVTGVFTLTMHKHMARTSPTQTGKWPPLLHACPRVPHAPRAPDALLRPQRV